MELAECLKRDRYAPEQVQDYYPTPGTASTVMYYTGIDPLTMKRVHVTTDYHEKQLQRALLQFNRPQNAPLVREALRKAGREDLIGFSAECLVRPERENYAKKPANGVKNHPKTPQRGEKKPQSGRAAVPQGGKTKNASAKARSHAKSAPTGIKKPQNGGRNGHKK